MLQSVQLFMKGFIQVDWAFSISINLFQRDKYRLLLQTYFGLQ